VSGLGGVAHPNASATTSTAATTVLGTLSENALNRGSYICKRLNFPYLQFRNDIEGQCRGGGTTTLSLHSPIHKWRKAVCGLLPWFEYCLWEEQRCVCVWGGGGDLIVLLLPLLSTSNPSPPSQVMVGHRISEVEGGGGGGAD